VSAALRFGRIPRRDVIGGGGHEGYSGRRLVVVQPRRRGVLKRALDYETHAHGFINGSSTVRDAEFTKRP
jgi:hypothetical protein